MDLVHLWERWSSMSSTLGSNSVMDISLQVFHMWRFSLKFVGIVFGITDSGNLKVLPPVVNGLVDLGVLDLLFEFVKESILLHVSDSIINNISYFLYSLINIIKNWL